LSPGIGCRPLSGSQDDEAEKPRHPPIWPVEEVHVPSSSSGIHRRALLSSLAMLPAFSAVAFSTSAPAQAPSDSLPSWNDGAAKQAILDFVRATTDRSSPTHVPPEERIAVFDQDGTLWVEHPMYTQVVYCLERVPAVVAKKPELRNVEPFKTVLSGNREAMARLSMRDLEKILAATLTGMSVDEFNAEIIAKTARTPSLPISRCSRCCAICATTPTGPTS
jgi:hypothetical protein